MRVLLGAAASVLVWNGAAIAGDEVLYGPPPEWVGTLRSIDASKLKDNDPLILLSNVRSRVERNGVLTIHHDRAFRIDSQQTRQQLGQLQIPWSPGSGDLTVHKIEILRGAERTDVLARNKRFEVIQREVDLEKLQISGVKTATLTIEDLQIGDVLRMQTSVSIKEKAIGEHVASSLILPPFEMRAKEASVELSWPEGMKLDWRAYYPGLAPVAETVGGYRFVRFLGALPKAPEMPSDAPSRFTPLPVLDISSFASWSEVSKTVAPLYRTDGLVEASKPLAAEVAKIMAKTADPRERAALSLRFVQDEIRYLYVGIDGGNLIPQSPADTLTRRYGDCKAKTLMLLAMLHAMGIKADAALVHSSLGDHLPARLPSSSSFDHVLVKAEVHGEVLWLDGTRNGARLEDLADTPAFRHALPLRMMGAELEQIATKPNKRFDVEIFRSVDQRAGTQMSALINFRIRIRGDAGVKIRDSMARVDEDQAAAFATKLFTDFVGEGIVYGSKGHYDPSTGFMTIQASGIMGGTWTRRDGRYRYALDTTLGKATFAPDRARTAWREIPYRSNEWEAVRTQVEIRLPYQGYGYVLNGEPQLVTQFAGANVVQNAKLSGDVASFDQRIDHYGVEIKAADIPAERTRVAQIKARKLEIVAPETEPPIWAQVGIARENGTLRPIIAAYTALVNAGTADAWRHETRGYFYTTIYDWKSALADYSKAIELEASGVRHASRAFILETLNRDKEALVDAEAALSFDPADERFIEKVARIKFRLGQRAEAIAMVEEQIALGDESKRRFGYSFAEMIGLDGRPLDAIAFMDDWAKASPADGNLLDDRCRLKAVLNVALDSALEDCSRGIELVEAPAAIYDSRALLHYRMGNYAEALRDADAALKLSPDMAAALFVSALAKSKLGDRSATDDVAVARMMDPRIDDEYAAFGVKY